MPDAAGRAGGHHRPRDCCASRSASALGAGGVLSLTGTIDPGAAERVAGRDRGARRVRQDGGAQLAGRLGERRAGHRRADAAQADSRPRSRPARSAPRPARWSSPAAQRAARHATSAIGVHQIYAAISRRHLPPGRRAAGDAMSDAQRTTAAITRYLSGASIRRCGCTRSRPRPTGSTICQPGRTSAYRLANSIGQVTLNSRHNGA